MTGGVWGLLVAAGDGGRFGGRKQFAEVHGVTLADRVVRRLRTVCDGIVVVLPSDVVWEGDRVDEVVAGGRTRAASVRAGLRRVPETAEIVVVHDPAHPLAPLHLFDDVVAAVRAGADAAAPGLALVEPLKRITPDGTVVETVPHGATVVLQTPQAFRAAVLRSVHADEPDAVEDTELVERGGGRVVIIPGDLANIHVTEPGHLDLVARLVDE